MRSPRSGASREISPLLRGALAGLAGTSAMTATMTLERRIRGRVDHPIDYDASDHVVTAAATVLGRRPRTRAGDRALFALVHWGYGSCMGIGRELTGPGPAGTARFYLGCQAMALVLFPTLGGTPPPWRWRGDVLATSLAQHAVYALAVAAARRRLGGG